MARGAQNAVLTSKAASTSTAQALAANSGRHGAIFMNDDTNACKLKFGEAAISGATDYSVSVAAGASFTLLPGQWCGPVHVIWGTAGAGGLRITEFS